MCTVALAVSGAIAGISMGLGYMQQQSAVKAQYAQMEASYRYQSAVAEAQYQNYLDKLDMQRQMVEAQIEYQDQFLEQQSSLYLQNAESANESYIQGTAALNQRMAEEEASTSFEIQKAQIEAQKAVGKILASSETSGLSLDALIADTYRQQAIYKDTMGYNQDVALGQLEREKTGLRQEAIRRINSYQMQTPTHQTITPPIYTPYVFQEQVATPMNWGGILGTGLNTFAQTGGVQATTNWLKTPSQKSKITMG